MKNIHKLIIGAMLFGGLTTIQFTGTARAANCQCGLCADDCACCTLKVDKVDEKKTAWEVECKQVCIPKVVFPWQKRCNPCANNGACVRTVRVLKKKEYKCPKLEFTWTPKMIGGCGCCGGGNNCCDDGSCGSCDNGGYLLGENDLQPALTPSIPTPAIDNGVLQTAATDAMIERQVPTVHVARPVGLKSLQLNR
ncbi:hypothetical protein [Rosistilla oblonga]|uniref:hypothetical protein n=1 Tax=Rosistilla oblonga TaxID=2527990 RepID=UPI003A9795CD